MTAGLRAIFDAAVAACDPRAAVAEAARELAPAGPVRVIAIGKAAVAMARGARDAVGDAIVEGLVVHPGGAAGGLDGLDVRVAAHPVPDERSEAAGRAALALAARVAPDEILLALISGGASALAAVPRDGLTLAAKRAAIAAVMRSGAPIAAINAARIARSALKGGRLAAACGGRVVTLVASDVPGDDPAVVGSGPTVPGRPGDVVRVVAGLGRLRAEAAAAARAAGWTVRLEPHDLVGDVAAVAARVLAARAPGSLWIAGGEWTVALDGAVGEGGRASELALLLARALRGGPGVALVGASDGVDGTGPGAGAIVDGATWEAIVAAGIDPHAALAGHDSGRALVAAGVAIVTGPTGRNHADLVMIAG